MKFRVTRRGCSNQGDPLNNEPSLTRHITVDTDCTLLNVYTHELAKSFCPRRGPFECKSSKYSEVRRCQRQVRSTRSRDREAVVNGHPSISVKEIRSIEEFLEPITVFAIVRLKIFV